MKIYRRESDNYEICDVLDRDAAWVLQEYGPGFVEYIPAGPTMEDLCGEKCKQCNAFLNGKLSAGFVYGGNTYQINGDAQDSIGKRATYAGWNKADPITFPWLEPYSRGWWDVTNTWHPMTVDEFMLFAKAVSDYVSACAACCRDHKSAITTENCETYDYTTGWPVNS